MVARRRIRLRGAEPDVGLGSATAWSTFRSVLPLLWPGDRPDLRTRVVVAIVALLAAKAATVYVPFLYKDAVDALTGGKAGDTALIVVPVALVVAYGVGRIMMVGLAQLRDAIFAPVEQYATRRLALRTFEHMHALSLRFHLERRTGGLSRIIERGTKALDFLLRFSLFNIVPTILELALVCGIFAWNFGIWYAAVTAFVVIAYVGFTFAVTEWRTRFRREMNDRDTEANTRAIDSLLNYETVKYFNNEAHEARRFDKSLAGYERAAVQTTTSLSVLNAGQAAIFSTGLASLMLMAGFGVKAGSMTVGDFVLINAMLIQLYQPLNLLGTVYREIRQALIDMETMFQLLGVPPEIEDRAEAKTLTVTRGEIRFEHVSFAYDPDRQILDDVSFTVPAGGMLAVVGPSGAGKSTLSRILYRFYEISGGRVSIDGEDIREVTQDSLRRQIGMVPQDTVLFNDTIRYNIRYGRPDASDEEVREAAHLAQIGAFIESLPRGYDTVVGERGLKLSGGEKQRVAIARTVLKNPPILILDEATSALDSHTEAQIQEALERIAQNRTTLVVAHRLSTVVKADEILVMVAGRIVERGSHAELLARRGRYFEMWTRQQEADSVRKDEARDEARDGAASAEQEPVAPSTLTAG